MSQPFIPIYQVSKQEQRGSVKIIPKVGSTFLFLVNGTTEFITYRITLGWYIHSHHNESQRDNNKQIYFTQKIYTILPFTASINKPRRREEPKQTTTKKGVWKVNETRIKVRETNGDHQGYIE